MVKTYFAIIVLFCIIFNCAFIHAVKISPTKTTLNINQYETNCTYIWVLPEENYSISSKWSEDGKGDLLKYTLSAERIKLNVSHTPLSDGKYRFCFTPSGGKNVSGIILFYSEKDMLEIGTWIELYVESASVTEKISLVTGNAIAANKEYRFDLISVLVLLVILFLLLLRNFLKSIVNRDRPSLQ